MKLMIDERVKHRLVGLAVILSIAAIFAPAIMKKSNQRIDGNVSVSVQLPPKPVQPNISMDEKKEMFNKVKTAKVELPSTENEKKPLPNLAKAESLSKQESEEPIKPAVLVGEALALADEAARLNASLPKEESLKEKVIKKPTAVTAQKIAEGIHFPSKSSTAELKKVKEEIKQDSKPLAKNSIKRSYAVQLATFSQLQNANSLVSKLKMKGYIANYVKVKMREGFAYRVLVGQASGREQAELLKKQLASAIQIRGIVVPAGEG